MRLTRRAGILSGLSSQTNVWKKYSITRGSEETRSLSSTIKLYGDYNYSIVEQVNGTSVFQIGVATQIVYTKTNVNNWESRKYTSGRNETSTDPYQNATIYEITSFPSRTSGTATLIPITIAYVGTVEDNSIFTYPIDGEQSGYYYKLQSTLPSLSQMSLSKHITSISQNFYVPSWGTNFQTQAEEIIGRAINDGDQSYWYSRLTATNSQANYYIDLSNLSNKIIQQITINVRCVKSYSADHYDRLTCYYGDRSVSISAITGYHSRDTYTFNLNQTSLTDLQSTFYIAKSCSAAVGESGTAASTSYLGYMDAVDAIITYYE